MKTATHLKLQPVIRRMAGLMLAGLTAWSVNTLAGSINTSDLNCVNQNVNQYNDKLDVWVAIAGLSNGVYDITVSYPGNPNDTVLGVGTVNVTSTAQCEYLWNLVNQTDLNGNLLPGPVQGFADSSNNAGVYKVTISGAGNIKKSDNFKVGNSALLAIICPSDLSVQCQGTAGTFVTFDAPVVSGGTGPDTYTVVCTANLGPDGTSVPVQSGDQFPCGTTTITCTVTDANGDTATCQFTVTVEDTVAPEVGTVALSLDATLECDDADGLAAALALEPTATDNCTANPVLHLVDDVSTPDPLCPSGFVQVRTWNFTDDCNNQSVDFVQTITVRDTKGPSFTCPEPLTGIATTPAGATVTVTAPVATDNCDQAPTVTGTRSDGKALTDPYPCCTTTITWTAVDACGNESSCEQSVIVTCIYTPGGRTLGFWSNKNGQLITTAADLCDLNSLNLRNGTGANFDPIANCAPTASQLSAGKTALSNWLLNANATSMAYMLSAQMAATELSVRNGFTLPTVIVDGSRTVLQEIAYANSLLANPIVGGPFAGQNGSVTKTATALRAEQERVKNILDKINNNGSFVQPCQ